MQDSKEIIKWVICHQDEREKIQVYQNITAQLILLPPPDN
jgi:hypothetical protein